ncbi:MAG: sugar transferase [Pyrinomonadaceae bacterium]|nr:sugar transferase [Pyrinomonadaceae bacterium]
MSTATAAGNKLQANIAAEPRRVPRYVLPLITAVVAGVDALLTAAALLLAFTLREGEPILSETAWAWSKEFVPYAGIFYFAVIIRIAMLAYTRVYRFGGAFSYANEAIKVFKAVAVGSLLIIAWAFLFRGGFAFREFSYSRGIFVLDFVLALAFLLAFHLAVRAAQAAVRRRDINLLPTLIVGTNAEAIQTIAELKERPDLGYRVVGVVTGETNGRSGEFEASPVIGSFDDLPELIRKLGIQEVIITETFVDSSHLFDVMMQVGRRRRVEFRFAPSLFNLLPQKTSVEQIGVLPMVRLFREPLSDVQRFVKRASDIVISSIAIAAASPVLAAIALIVKFGSRGPVVFKQERVGMDGRIFLCYKFRTMYADADEAIHREAFKKNIVGHEEANAGDSDEPVYGKVKDDPRITPAGRWLRRSSLDELPQLFNVLKGDMSVVGPRPPIPYEVENYELWHRKRLDMKPGITGLWQVSGRNRLRFDEMVRIDIYYIENWSLWLDLKIILLTLPAVFRGDGAR